MLLSRLLPALLFLAVIFVSAEEREMLPGEPTREDLKRARSMLTQWEENAPEKARRVMRICY